MDECKNLGPGRDGKDRCGTVNGYCNLGCHGPACKDAWAAAHRKYTNADPSRQEKHREGERLRRYAQAVVAREGVLYPTGDGYRYVGRYGQAVELTAAEGREVERRIARTRRLQPSA